MSKREPSRSSVVARGYGMQDQSRMIPPICRADMEQTTDGKIQE